MTEEPIGTGIEENQGLRRLWTPQDHFATRNEDGTVLVESTARLVRFGNRAAPEWFNAWFSKPGLPATVMRIAMIDGRFACTHLQVAAEENRKIDSHVLRTIPVPTLVHEAVATAVHVVVELDTPARLEQARLLFELDSPRSREELDLRVGDSIAWPALGPPSAPPDWVHDNLVELEDPMRTRAAARRARLKHVAEIYTRAYAAGDETTEAVRREQGISRQSAKNIIADARKKGFLPPTTRGKRRA